MSAPFAIHLEDHRLTRMGPGEFATEASALGWSPGQWPDDMTIILPNGERHEIGNEAGARHDEQGELECVVYCSRQIMVTVLND